MSRKTKPKLYIIKVTHADGFEYKLTCRELFDAMVIDKMTYPNDIATYLVGEESNATEMTTSPRLAQYKAHKLIYEDHYTNADGKR